jgi:hypothetical protein
MKSVCATDRAHVPFGYAGGAGWTHGEWSAAFFAARRARDDSHAREKSARKKTMNVCIPLPKQKEFVS